jgi:polyhydroxybutyrate depolymerase
MRRALSGRLSVQRSRFVAGLVFIACCLAVQVSPAAAQDDRSAASRPLPKDKAKKPAPKKPAAKKPAPKKPQAKPKAASKPQANAQPRPPARPPIDVGPKFSSDVESAITKPGAHRFVIQHGGLQRSYLVHVPAVYNASTPMPLIVALHRAQGNMEEQANDGYYGLVGKAEREGFILVVPNGSSKVPGAAVSWNVGSDAARAEQPDDVGFLRQVVAHVFRQVAVERDRIYAVGLGNGGAMAYRFACEAPGLFKAIAVIGASDSARDCNPDHPVSVLHIHAKDDTRVPLASGRAAAVKWAQLDGCSATPRRTLDQSGASCEVYSYCQRKAEVQLCVTDTGGSSWPGGKSPLADARPSNALSATYMMWDFFSRH